MGDVISFPTKAVRDWQTIERAMTGILAASGVPRLAQEHLAKTMKQFFDFLQLDLSFSINASFPAPISQSAANEICKDIGNKVSASIKGQVQDYSEKLFIERLMREIDVCRQLGSLHN